MGVGGKEEVGRGREDGCWRERGGRGGGRWVLEGKRR